MTTAQGFLNYLWDKYLSVDKYNKGVVLLDKYKSKNWAEFNDKTYEELEDEL